MPKGKEIPKRVGAVIKQGTSRLVFVDNQEQVFSTYLIHCSQCGRVVYSLDSTFQGLSGAVSALEKQMLDSATYCPMCGHKLEYKILDIIEGEYTEGEKIYPDGAPLPPEEVKPVEEQSVETKEEESKEKE
jgi:DNA-directed RNA polymerase subunit RPC12/RpoP